MDVEKIRIVIETVFEDDAFVKANNRTNALAHIAENAGTNVGALQRILKLTGAEVVKVGNRTWAIRDAITNTPIKASKAWGTLIDRTTRFRMELLSVMFFGYTLQRVFGGFLKGAIQGYMKLTEAQTPAGKAILRMQAAFEFMKFAIIDALAPAIIWFTDIVTKIADWVGRNPDLAYFLGLLIGIGAAAGIVMGQLGNIGLFVTSSLTPALKKMGGSWTKLGISIGESILTLGAFVVAAYLAYRFIEIYMKEMEYAVKWHSKAATDAAKKDWTSWKVHTIAEMIESEYAWTRTIDKFFTDIGRGLLDGLFKIWTGIWVGAEDILARWRYLGDPEGYANYMEGVYKKVEEMKETHMTMMARIGFDQEERAFNTYINAIQTLYKRGYASVEDLFDVYGFEKVRDALGGVYLSIDQLYDLEEKWKAKTDAATEANTNLNDVLASGKDELTKYYTTTSLVNEGINNNINYLDAQAEALSRVTEQVEGLNNAWRVAGTQGIWTFKPGTSEETIQKMIEQISASTTGLQRGGYIEGEGLAYLHRGETVVPKGGGLTFSPTYNVTGTDASSLKRVLEEHDRQLLLEIQRIKIPGS